MLGHRQRPSGAAVRPTRLEYLRTAQCPAWKAGELLGDHKRDLASARDERGRDAGSVHVRMEHVRAKAALAQLAVSADPARQIEGIRRAGDAYLTVVHVVSLDPLRKRR